MFAPMMKKVAGTCFCLQDVEDLRRPFRIGPVVEGQRQLLGHLRRRWRIT